MFSSEQIEKLRPMLQTGGWRDVVLPVLEARKKALQDIVFMLPSERPEPYRSMDDATVVVMLRGEQRATDWVVRTFINEVNVHDYNARLEQANPLDPASTT